MSKTFRPWLVDQPQLLPPSVMEFVPDVDGEVEDLGDLSLGSGPVRAYCIHPPPARPVARQGLHRPMATSGPRLPFFRSTA